MKRFWICAGLVACAGAAEPTDPTDVVVDPDVDCISAEDALSTTLTRAGAYTGEVILSSTCSQPVDRVEVGLSELVVGLTALQPASTRIEAGGELSLPLMFDATDPGSFSDTLVVSMQGQPSLEVPLLVEVAGPELAARATPQTLVRTCPSTLTLGLDNNAELGEGEIRSASATLEDVELGWELAAPTWIAPGSASEAEVDVVLLAAESTLKIEVEDGLVGLQSWDLPVLADASAERDLRLPAWTDGRPVDVLVTVDRRAPGLDSGQVVPALAAFFQAMASMDADVLAVGLLREDGCPMGGSAVTGADPERAAEVLAAQLDLDFNRVGETGIESRPFELVGVALDPTNTEGTGCNAWRRTEAALLVVHLMGADDASGGSVADHVASLRARVPAPDHLAIASVAPASDCTEGGVATRLMDAASATDAVFADLCELDVEAALRGLATSPGEENLIRLPDAPYPPSLEVLAGGKRVDVTLDGDRIELPRSVDRIRSDIEIRYVVASACPAG